MSTAAATAAIFIQRLGADRHSARAKAKAAQVWPDGKELGSELFTSTSKSGMTTHGLARLSSGLMVRLVTIRPKVMAVSAVPPLRRVLLKNSISTASAINNIPAFPSVV